MEETRAYPDEIEALTSLRFFAAAGVLISHLRLFVLRISDKGNILDQGFLGVDFFFILSGFILAHVYCPQLREGSFSTRHFLVNRIARIYPLHVAVMAIIFIMASVVSGFGDDLGFHSLVTNLLMVQAWGFDRKFSFNPPSWSISAEWFAYLLFPVLIVLFSRLKPLTALIAALWIYGAMWELTEAIYGIPFTKLTLPFGELRILPEFCLGMGMYMFGQARPRLRGGPISLAFCYAGIFLLIRLQAPGPLIVLLLGLSIFMIAEASRRRDRGVLTIPALVYLGEISYALYMIHYVVLFGVWYFRGSKLFYGLVVAALPATIGLAVLLHHTVELPCRRWIRRLGSRNIDFYRIWE